jgi:hypothetical protein
MPCNGGYPYHNDPELKSRLDLLTRLLCSACQLLEANGTQLPAELDVWWTEHQLADKQRALEDRRQAEEAKAKKDHAAYLRSVKARVLQQLTDEEREALGLQEPRP